MKIFKRFFILLLVLIVVITLFIPEFSYASSIKLNTKSITINVYESYKLKVIGTKSTVKWKSSDKSIAVVYKSGIVKGISEGKAVISAMIGKKKLTCSVTINKKIENKPNIEIKLINSNEGKTTVAAITITNNGDLPFTFDCDAFVSNEGYNNLCSEVNLFDANDSENFQLVDSMSINSGETRVVYYRNEYYKNFWVDDETNFLFNFTYDEVEFYGLTDTSGYFNYKQGIFND